jgi:hypothetical protein
MFARSWDFYMTGSKFKRGILLLYIFESHLESGIKERKYIDNRLKKGVEGLILSNRRSRNIAVCFSIG